MVAKAIGAARLDVMVSARGMKKGNRQVKQQAGVLTSTLGSAKKAVAGFALAYAGMRGISAIGNELKEIDKVGKTARKLGMMTEELIALRHAAVQSGLAVTTFDMAMQRVTRRVSEAAKGTGEAKAAIAELGLNPKDLVSEGPAKTLESIADALMKVKAPADKLRLAFKLFDSEGVALVNMLDKGAAGIQAYRKDAERLGILLNEREVMQAEEANNALDRLSKSFGALGSQLAVSFAPKIKSAADALTGFIASLSGGKGGKKTTSMYEQYQLLMLKNMAQASDLEAKFYDMTFQKGAAEGSRSEASSYREQMQALKDKIYGTPGRPASAPSPDPRFSSTPITSNSRGSEKDPFFDPLRKELELLKMGEDAYLEKQMKTLGYQQYRIDQFKKEREELKGLTAEHAKIKKAEQDKLSLMQEQQFVARSIFEETLTGYEQGRLKQQEILDAEKQGLITKEEATRALVANKQAVMDEARSKSLSASSVVDANVKGSAGAYSAIVSALGRKNEQKEIAANTKKTFEESEKAARTLEQLLERKSAVNMEVVVGEL